MALTRDWHEIVVTQSSNAVPLNQIQCPFCGVGEPLDPNSRNPAAVVGVIPNDNWQNSFEVCHHEAHTPQGNAFEWDNQFPAKNYGLISLRCKNCHNTFFVHYLIRSSSDERPRMTQFWSRLIVPNIDFVERENAISESEQLITELHKESKRLERHVKLWQVAALLAFIAGSIVF